MSGDQAERIWGLIPAAGSGERMGKERPKQYLQLLDHSLLGHAVRALAGVTGISGIVVVLAEDDKFWPTLVLENIEIQTATGGPTRARSVLNGLHALREIAGADDWVLVHDAARPCIRVADIERLIDAVNGDKNGGLLALPINDTVKREHDARSMETLDRSHLWRAQTPQFFPIKELALALRAALAGGVAITDEANAMELQGFKPKLVPGSEKNIKVTYPRDLAIAELFLSAD